MTEEEMRRRLQEKETSAVNHKFVPANASSSLHQENHHHCFWGLAADQPNFLIAEKNIKRLVSL